MTSKDVLITNVVMGRGRASLPERLQATRLRAGLSARRLDELAGLTPGYTSLIESGKRANIGARTADLIARVIGVSLDWLIRGEGDEPTDIEVARAVECAQRSRERELKRTGTEG